MCNRTVSFLPRAFHLCLYGASHILVTTTERGSTWFVVEQLLARLRTQFVWVTIYYASRSRSHYN